VSLNFKRYVYITGQVLPTGVD